MSNAVHAGQEMRVNKKMVIARPARAGRSNLTRRSFGAMRLRMTIKRVILSDAKGRRKARAKDLVRLLRPHLARRLTTTEGALTVLKCILFFGALLCWVAGLLGIVHWSYNFQYDPDFFSLSQIGKSLFSAGVFYAGGALLIGLFMERRIYEKRRSILRSCSISILTIMLVCTAIWARPSAPDCGEVVRRMKDSGVAYNAKEGGLLGGIKIDEPSGDRFSPDANQLAWWGKFGKPFEYWGSPDLTSNWFDPENKPVASIKVETEHCKLAKAVIKQKGFQPGIWRVDVVCENDGKIIDQQRFAVGDPPVVPSDVQAISASVQESDSKEIRV